MHLLLEGGGAAVERVLEATKLHGADLHRFD
jgi:hypothetical protein